MSSAVRYHWRTEVIDGVERELPTPKPLHIRIQRRVERIMYAAMDAYPQYEVLPGLDTLLDRGRDYLCPDIVVTRSDATYDKDNDMLHARDALLAVEILSPGQTVDELFGKCKLLAAAGCPVCWVIHGEKRRAYLCDSFHDYSQVSRLEAHTLPADFWIPVDLLWP